MIINRYRATIKRGRIQEAVEMLKAVEGVKRIGAAFIGNNDVITWDFEFEDMDAVSEGFTDLLNPEKNKTRIAELADWWDLPLAVENELLNVLS